MSTGLKRLCELLGKFYYGFQVSSAILNKLPQLVHLDPSDEMEMLHVMKNLAITGGFVFLVAQGTGAISIDRRQARMIDRFRVAPGALL